MDNDCFEPAGYSSLPVGGSGGGGGGGSAAPSGQATVGGLKLHLPLDEDDYLMPSNGQQAGYMDLGGHQKGELPAQPVATVVSFLWRVSLQSLSYVMSQIMVYCAMRFDVFTILPDVFVKYLCRNVSTSA